MQINKISNKDQAFGAKLRVPQKDIIHVMSTIDRRCNDMELVQVYNTIAKGEKGKGSKDVVFIRDHSKTKNRVRPQKYGFLKAKIGDSTYTNDVVLSYSFWNLPHFFEKIQRISKEKYTGVIPNAKNRLNEIAEQNDIMMYKLFGPNKSAPKDSQTHRKFILNSIYTILTKKV